MEPISKIVFLKEWLYWYTNRASLGNGCPWFCLYFTFLLGLLSISGAHAQVFVANFGNNTIGEYSTSGTTINASLIAGLSNPVGIAVSGNDIFVANTGSNTIGEYTTSGSLINASLISGVNLFFGAIAVSGSDLYITTYKIVGGVFVGSIGEYTTSGTLINPSLVTGLRTPTALAVSESDLFVTDFDDGSVAEYLKNGTLINSSLVTNLDDPYALAVSGSSLLVANYSGGATQTIGEYTTGGATINASLVQGLHEPAGIAISGGDLFVTSEPGGNGSGLIGKYTTNGVTVNSSLVTGLSNPMGIAVIVAPEPSLEALMIGSLCLLCFCLNHESRRMRAR